MVLLRNIGLARAPIGPFRRNAICGVPISVLLKKRTGAKWLNGFKAGLFQTFVDVGSNLVLTYYKVFAFAVRRAQRHEIYGLARFPRLIRRTCGNHLADEGGQQIGGVLPSRSGRDTRTLIDEIKRVSVIGGDAVEPLTLLEASLVMAGPTHMD